MNSYPRTSFQIRDPFIVPEDGVYYLFESTNFKKNGHRGVSVRMSTDLENWTEERDVMVVDPAWNCELVWAPEVHKYAGRYYLFTTLTQALGTREMKPMSPDAKPENLWPRGTWVFVSDSLTGPFKPVKIGPVPPEELQTLDGTLYVEDGKPYMVYCHEWCQVANGTMNVAPLADDFTHFTAPPTKMFAAFNIIEGANWVTDGPFFYRSPATGILHMIWATGMKGRGYVELTRRSESGKIEGPWSTDEILFGADGEDGGHGMIFRAFDGTLRLTLHQPNWDTAERMQIFPIEERDGKLVLTSKE